MAIITRCCCFQNVRSGSFAAGFYSLVLYTIILTAGALNLYAVLEDTGMFVLTLVTILLSVFCFIASVLLLIGLCVDSRVLMIPWLGLVFVATFVDLLISLHLLIKALFNPFLVILFAVDFIILSLNTYSLICVYSQYQEYCAGRGNPQVRGNRPECHSYYWEESSTEVYMGFL
ncbi:unnamed protein product [Larinioides sclopetarius]|uniref:MARVEL domain-containing protein n=1 Tax=Larinioides sclopetarius TaxID=280406 RepID=A0AAV1Z1U8_9ARAC